MHWRSVFVTNIHGVWKPGRGRVNDFDQFEQRSHVYDAVHYNADFSRGPQRPRYNVVACINKLKFSLSKWEVCVLLTGMLG